MANSLRTYFPTLQSREEILGKIHGSKELEEIFHSWQEKQREEFLDFCTGAKGVKMLYDFCIKAILNPEIYPERLEELISLLLGKKGKRKISSVYTIVLFEKSTPEFHQFPDKYIHKFQQESNTGLKLNLLQKFVFVALDIYRKNQQNKNIKNRLNGWLTFLSSDAPEDIIALIEKYPDFKPMYAQVYEICQNIEQVMGMFSKELRELDRNTVQLMIDEMQEELNQVKRKVEEEKQKAEEEKQKAEEERQKAERKEQELEETRQAYEKALKRIEELERTS